MDTSIKDFVKEFITDELIEKAVHERVRDYVADHYSVRFDHAIYNVVETIARERGDEYVREAIEHVINGKVRIDDGWGNTCEMGSFDDLVKRRISKCLNDGWNVQSKVREAVDNKIKKLCEQVRKEHVDNMAEQVIERLAEEKNDGKL